MKQILIEFVIFFLVLEKSGTFAQNRRPVMKFNGVEIPVDGEFEIVPDKTSNFECFADYPVVWVPPDSSVREMFQIFVQ